MFDRKENDREYIFPSPLKLLYTVYSDQRPVMSQAMEQGFQKIDKILAPLSEQDRNAVFRTFYEVYSENEALAFQAGVRTGIRLAEELV